MAKLYFRFGAMNSGKSTALLQAVHNYQEQGRQVLLLKPAVDTKGDMLVVSRLGVSKRADVLIHPEDRIRDLVVPYLTRATYSALFVDEAQFLTRSQVDELMGIVLDFDLPVLTYGLRTDFQAAPFPGAQRLLEIAHTLEELKTICRCGRKAILNSRKINGVRVFDGDQVAIDGEETTYESLCASCYYKEKEGALSEPPPILF